jgi:DNA-binding NarL/FixJ family response regulator
LLVELAHPLYGELVRDALPETAARRIRRDIAAAAVGKDSATPAERLRVARLLLESGQVDEERFLDAGSIALLHGAPDLARRLAEALPPSLPAALGRARALARVGRFGDVDDVLAPFEEAAATAEDELASTYVEVRVRSLLAGPGDQPESARPLIDRVEAWRDDADWRALVAAVRCWTAVWNRAYSAAWSLVEAPLADPAVSTHRRRLLLHAYGLALPRLGRVDDCLALVAEVGQLAEAADRGAFDIALDAARVQGTLIVAGRDLVGVRDRVGQLIAEAQQRGDLLEYAFMLYLLGELEHVQGHHAEALALYQRTVDLIASVDPYNLRPTLQVMLAISAAYLGDERAARRAIADAEGAMRSAPGIAPWVAPDLARAAAMAELAAGRVSAARDQLLAVAAEAGDDVLIESESLHVALLLGADPAPCARRLEALASHAQDDVVHLWARHARAVADRDPSAQLAAAEAFDAAGLDLDAAQAAALAATALREAGLARGATRAESIAASAAARCPGVQVPALEVRPDAEQLSPREREIAGLAARGATNADIAEALVLSKRTVETYVLRIYRKLGVNNRRGLAKALAESQL